MTESPNTHLSIDHRLAGAVVALAPRYARVELTVLPEMAADERGLAHGGFVFGVADYAAMLAINHPHVVLGAAEVRFLKPVVVGDTLVAEAWLEAEAGKKRMVKVEVRRGETTVLIGMCTCFVPEQHVLGTL